MKKFIIAAIAALTLAVSANAQIYDGITQPTTYRVWTSATQSLNGGDASFGAFMGYKYDVAKWFNVTGIAQYNFNSRQFSPAVWLGFNICDRVYLLSRNIYDANVGNYRQTLSASVKIPKGFMVDATWDNMFNHGAFCQGDRLQVVGGWGNKWCIFNVGYSMRAAKGVIANIRFKMTNAYWLQFKYDGGLNAITTNIAYHF
jgi:hypothetical protein